MAERSPYATVNDIEAMWRPLTTEEQARAAALLPLVSDTLRQEALNRGQDLDAMITAEQVLETVVKSVTVDVTTRTLLSSTSGEPMTQESQSALGYSWSGTYFNAGGGIFVKNSELKRLGLRRQKIEVIEPYDTLKHRDSFFTGQDSNGC